MLFSFTGRYFNKRRHFFSYDFKDYSFKVDLEFGELYFTRKLMSFSGKHLPLNLSLKYVQSHINGSDCLCSLTGFPQGFKTNFHVFLEYDSYLNKYKYEDADGFVHEFTLAYNSSTLYYDNQGSGLMLITQNNGYKVFDDDGNYQLFDQYGRLTLIYKKVTSSYGATQFITYCDNNSLKISSIVDNYERIINFTYNNLSIQISYQNNTVATIYKDYSYYLTKISKNIGGHLVEDSVQYNVYLSNIVAPDASSVSFNYSNDRIASLVTNIKQDAFTFHYPEASNDEMVVANMRGVETNYNFTDDSSLSQTSENSDDLCYYKLNSDIASCLIRDETENNEITVFKFGIDNSESIDTSSYSNGFSNNIINQNLQSKKMYVFVAEINGNLASDSFVIQLFDYDDNLLAELVFKGKTKTLSFPVGIRASTQKQFYLKYFNKCPNSVEVKKAHIYPLVGDFEILCSNVDFGGPIFFYGDEPHYHLKDSGVAMLNNDNVLQYCFSFKRSDYLANERNFYKSNPSHFWCNDKTMLIDGAVNVLNIVNSNQYIAFNRILSGIIYCTPDSSNLNPQGNLFLYRIKGNDNQSFLVTKVSHKSDSFHPNYTSFYYEEEEKMHSCGNAGYITYYDYDSNYSLVEVNRDDGYKEEYEYDNHANLISKTISHSNVDEQIKYSYSYDSNDNLISENKLVGNSNEEIVFDYDDFGNLLSIDYPNDLSQSFEYDNVSGERNLSTSFDDNDAVTIAQDNNYIDDYYSSYSSGDNAYLFSYYAENLLGVFYNEQQIVSLQHYTPIHSGYPLNTRYVAQYLNGYFDVCEKDAFDRVILDGGLVYTYDDFSKIVNVYDGALGGFNPNTSYTYDYYSELTCINVENGGLSLCFNRDIYRRLTSKTYLLNNGTLYSASYLYYLKPGLESTVKQSLVSFGSIIIEQTDDTDDLSRLTSQSTSFNNCSFSKSISYCTGGTNNGFTNNMIQSVTYSEYTPLSEPVNPSHILPSLNLVNSDHYSYDNVGNIVSIARHVGSPVLYQTDYVYDAFSRLIRENNPLMNKTYTYSYDDQGNIASKKEYAYSTNQSLTNPLHSYNYQYDEDFPNRLIRFDTQDIQYDAIGNPTLYKGQQLAWTRGTLLSEVSDTTKTIELTYDGFKQRIAKTITNLSNNNVTSTEYYYIDGQLLKENTDNKTITYIYSHQGIIGFSLSGYSAISNLNGTYLYEKNIQQDVIAIRNSSNQIVARYIYDAWGNHKVLNPNNTPNTSDSFIGNINPIRYRSYYYDTDLKMYWLTTRYYDPEIGRFISPDHYSYLDYKRLHGINLYAYSKNNPVMYYDPSGHFLIPIVILIGTIIINTATNQAKSLIEKTQKNEDPNKDYNNRGDEDVFVKLNDGTKIYYIVGKDANWNDPNTSVEILDSWKYKKEQIIEFATALKHAKNSDVLNIRRMVNEWYWHTIAFYLGYGKEPARSANICLDADDDHENKIISYVINNYWWFY